MQTTRKRILVIACGVLKLDLSTIIKRYDMDIDVEYLDGGLHEVPNQLRTLLQERIDEAAATTEYERIAIGYGICGRGTVGLYARNIPLTIPKVHDCIALFLGSDLAYRKEFNDNPGTYYISGGWFEEQVQPQGNKIRAARSQDEALRKAGFDYFKEKYGEQNAQEIARFYNSWQKNYSRAGFIDTGVGNKETYASYAKDLAEAFDWEYKRLPGTHQLLESILTEDKTTDEILYVPPDHVTEYDPKGKGLIAVPVWSREGDTVVERLSEGKQGEEKHPGKADRIRVISKEGTSKGPGEKQSRRYGLGIDAGGTYTDSAIYEFNKKTVLTKGKGLTTKWDFTIGIRESISKLEQSYLGQVDLVSVSTTLATNAIVEGYGQKVGLLLMPSGVYDPDQIDNRSTAVVSGRLTISGVELEPVDKKEVQRVVRKMAGKDEVKVFAISGYAGSVNPEHELLLKHIVYEETGLYACCGHELSDLLNFYVRANTAVLNARIIPLLEKFLQDIEATLAVYGITAPVMVVKGDGSLMSGELAKNRPIETVLSGPAASIAGARYLTGVKDATVIDVGGTTSDIGCIAEGLVEVCPKGAKVGGWRTHVRALDMNTLGLGGDSEILFEEQQLLIGPKRIAPVSWLGAGHDLRKPLHYIESNVDYYLTTTMPLEFLVLTGESGDFEKIDSTLSEGEQKLITALQKGPCSLIELAERMKIGHWMMLNTKMLEDAHIVQRCGLTPTDILHVMDKLDLWDRESAVRLTKIVGKRMKIKPEAFSTLVFNRITDRLVTELMKKQLNLDEHSDTIDTCPACAAIMHNILTGGNSRFRLSARFLHPIIGLGAPVGYFMEAVPGKIQAEMIIPEHADVANAIGAITSFITVTKRLSIVPTEKGTFGIQGLPETPDFVEFEDAHEYAREALEKDIISLARKAGTSEATTELHSEDRISATADGSELFLERILSAKITGPPDLACSPG